MTKHRLLHVSGVVCALLACCPPSRAGQDEADRFWPATSEAAEETLAKSLDASATADDWTQRAWALSRYRSDHAAAAEAAAKAIAVEADHYKAHEIAGIAAQFRGNYDESFEHYLKLLPADRLESEIYLGRIDTLNLSRSQRAQFLETLQKAAAEMTLGEVYRFVLLRRIAAMLADNGELAAAAERLAQLKPHTDWMVIGPFNNEENAGFSQEYGPETEIDYAKSYQGRDREVSWQRLRHVDPTGAIDFDAVMYPNSNVLAYALTFVHMEKDTEAVLRIGAGNAVKAWVNDQLLLANDEDVAFVPDQYEVPCRLPAGWNKLLVKVCERHDQWRLAVRFTTTTGAPLSLRTDAKRGEVLEIRETPKAEGKAEFDYVRGLRGHYQRLHEGNAADPAIAYYLAQAETLTNRKMGAVATFEKLVELNGKCSEHRLLLARACLADERPEKALVELKEAVALEPNNVECLAELGRFYDNKGLFEKALETLRQAAKIAPEWPDAQYYLLELYGNKDWEEEIWRQAKWLLAKRPDVAWVLQTYAEQCMNRGYRKDAAEHYKKVLEQEYGNAEARQSLISLAVDERRLDDALEQYSTLLRTDPLSISYRLAKADLLMEYERHEEALAVCREALDICDANFRVHRLMGKVHQRMDQDQKAKEAWRLALKYNPDDKWIREYLEFLEPETIAAFEEYGVDADAAAEIVKQRVDPDDHPKADAVRLLDHLVVEMNDDASYTGLRHQIIQIINDTGRDRFTSMGTGGFDAKIKRAVVIQPDGSEIEASRVSGGQVKFGQLQVGSIIELKHQNRGSSNEWLSRHYTRTFTFQGTAPALRSQFILLVPKTRSIRHAIQGERVKLTEGEFEDHVVYDFRADDLPMIEPENNRPPMLDIADLVRVSTIPDWDEIIRWEYSLVKDQFVADEAVRQKAKDLAAGAADRAEKIRAVAQFVMQKVQYRQDYDQPIMGMKPHKAGNVLEKEVGDCKDKATLLITMLREAGVPANYVTLRTRTAGRLRPDIPSNQCNHAIVYVPQEDDFSKGVWIDGTANYTGIDTLPWQDQGVQVMVFKDDGQMVFMDTPVDPPSHSLVEYDFDARLGEDGAAKITLKWTATGQYATTLRQSFEAEGLRQQRLEQFANYIYSGSRVTKIDFSDLTDRDIPVLITCKFNAPNVGQVSGAKMVLRPKELLQLARSYADKTERTYDIWNAFIASQRFVEKYRLPKGYRVETMPSSAKLETKWLEYEIAAKQTDKAVEIRRELRVKALEIPKSAYDEVREFCINADKYQREPLILIKDEKP